MSEWKKVKFLDVVSLNPRVSLEKGAVYPFVEMSNAVPGARKPEKDVYQKYSGGGAKFEEGDTVVARIEPCLQNGKGFQCSYKKGFGSTEFLVFRPLNLKEMDCDYLYYYMGQQSIREAMAKTMVGASGRQRVNNAVFNDLQINLPPLKIQQEIASILSRYDSLIENYRKQIKLLEEAAQRLYKEWFVELRFPGHENTKMVDGLPEGWKKGVLEDIASESGKKVDKKVRDNFKYYLPIDCLPKQSLTYLSPADISLAESSLVSFAKGDILFGAMRPYFHKVCFAQSSGLTRSTCFVLNAKDSDYQGFLLMLLFDEGTIKHATSISVGTTMPYTRWKEFKSMKILIPNKELAITFGEIIEIVKNRLMRLASLIRLLTEARDRLLPRLMGGEMDVKNNIRERK